MAKKKRKTRAPELIAYSFRILSFEVGYTHSAGRPETLSKHEVRHRYDGVRPKGPVTFESAGLELQAELLEPVLTGVTHVGINLSASLETPRTAWSSLVGLIHRHKDTLRCRCSIPPLGLQALLTLLCSGQQINLTLDSEKLRYRKAWAQNVFWYTEGHSETRALREALEHGGGRADS